MSGYQLGRLTANRTAATPSPLGIGVHDFAFTVHTWTDIAIQWLNHVADGTATITLYGALLVYKPGDAASLLTDEDGNLAPLDTNPYWSLLPGTFANQPGAAIGSEIVPIADSAVMSIGVRVDVTVAFSDIELRTSVRSRG